MGASQNLNRIVDIDVYTDKVAATRETFNIALILGSTNVIPASERLRNYLSVDDMLEDGFSLTDPEYIAANIYFSQSPAPDEVYIGRQDLTSSPAETILEALQDCRTKNTAWYIAVCPEADNDDHKLIAAYVETATPSTVYFFNSSDADILEAAPSPVDIVGYLKALSYSRTMAIYGTTQSAVYPNNIYEAAAAAGRACGLTTGLANSAYTMKFKDLVGIATEPLTTAQITNMEAKNCNVYLYYNKFYNWFEQGEMVNGMFYDRRVFLDMLVNDIQLSVADLLNAAVKIPQTDSGVTQLIQACNSACENSKTLGFLGPGTWTGVDVLNLKNGDTLPKGYLVQAASLADQSTADRTARKSPTLYVAIKEAGAIHSVLIGIYDNQ